MHNNNFDGRFLQRWSDNNFYYFIWGESSPPDIYEDMLRDTHPSAFYVIGPEEWEPVEIYPNGWEFEAHKLYNKVHNIDFKVLVGCILDKENYRYKYLNEPAVVSHPTYFAHAVIAHSIDLETYPYEVSSPKKLFTSLNGRPHPWRCMFIDRMYKHGLFDHGYVSWHELDKFDDYNYEFQWWTPTKLEFDKSWQREDGMCDIYTPPAEFKDSVFSLISESNTECLFYTEKTFVPIFHKRPFLIYGAPHANTYLRKLGFEIFDEVIDYSFDSIDNDKERCERYFEQVVKLTEYPLDDLYNLLYNKVQHNYMRMLEIVENKEYVPKFFDKITKRNHDHIYLSNYSRILNIGTHSFYSNWKR